MSTKLNQCLSIYSLRRLAVLYAFAEQMCLDVQDILFEDIPPGSDDYRILENIYNRFSKLSCDLGILFQRNKLSFERLNGGKCL